ncbi:MAG: (Fe-S)-binding protein [Anaerolineae bacterium]
MVSQNLQQIVERSRAYHCLECGKCTSVCPLARQQVGYSPRRTVEETLYSQDGTSLSDPLLWSCLTCYRCALVCPQGVDYAGFVRDLRREARGVGYRGHCTHGQAIESWMRLMGRPDTAQERIGWLDGAGQISTDGEMVYFVGCLSYYEALFHPLGFQGVKIARSAIRVLNHLGLKPIVLADERCCGHDLLWQGDCENFRRLAEINLTLLHATGAQRLVTTCPECYRTLKVDYPAYVGHLGMEVLHISELLAEQLLKGELQIADYELQSVTYHDPCRLGRHMRLYDEPRQVIESLGLELVEMAHNRNRALCCGTSAWTNCGAANKQIQVERLREAKATGAEMLVTACPKCQIHLKCAMADERLGEEIEMEIQDLTTLAGTCLGL